MAMQMGKRYSKSPPVTAVPVLLHIDNCQSYCYIAVLRTSTRSRPSSTVCQSICRSVTLLSPAKTAEPTEMPFGLRTRVGPGNHVLDGGPDPSWERAILREGERGGPL